MIWFYRDFLDGPIYYVVLVLSIIFIMALIGFVIERKQLEREKKNREAVLNDIVNPNTSSVMASTSVNNVTNQVSSTPNPPQQQMPIPNPGEAVIPDINSTSNNAATNENIPSVLDLDAIDSKNGQ